MHPKWGESIQNGQDLFLIASTKARNIEDCEFPDPGDDGANFKPGKAKDKDGTEVNLLPATGSSVADNMYEPASESVRYSDAGPATIRVIITYRTESECEPREGHPAEIVLPFYVRGRRYFSPITDGCKSDS
jgi:hypothetical protein